MTSLPPLNTRDSGPSHHRHRMLQKSSNPITHGEIASPPYARDSNNAAPNQAIDMTALLERIASVERENETFKQEVRQMRLTIANHVQNTGQTQNWVTNSVRDLQSHVQNSRKAQVPEVAIQDIETLKAALQAKAEADNSQFEKEKQKAAVLFAEVVRLGKVVESLSDQSKNSMKEVHHRVQDLEKKAEFGAMTSQAVENRENTKMEETNQRSEELAVQVATMKNTIQLLRDELTAERSERRKAESQKDNEVAELAAKSQRTEGLIDERIAAHLSSLSNKVESQKSLTEKLVEDTKGEALSRDLERSTAYTTEMKQIHDRIVAFEALLVKESQTTKTSLLGIAKENEERFQAITLELGKEVTSRSTIQQQIEDEFRKRLGDLNDATRDITAEIQTGLVELEEVVRAEIKTRITTTDSIRARLEKVIQALSSAVEHCREDLTQVSTTHGKRLDRVENAFDELNMNLEARVKECQRSIDLEQDVRLNKMEVNIQDIRVEVEESESARADIMDQVSSSINEHKELTALAFESLQKALMTNYDDVREIIEHNREHASEELSLLAESLHDMTWMWNRDIHDEMAEFQSEATNAFQSILSKQDQTQAEFSKHIHGIQNHVDDFKIKLHTMECIESLVTTVVEENVLAGLNDLSDRVQENQTMQQVQDTLHGLIQRTSEEAQLEATQSLNRSLASHFETIDAQLCSSRKMISAVKDDHDHYHSRHSIKLQTHDHRLQTEVMRIENTLAQDKDDGQVRSCVESMLNEISEASSIAQNQALVCSLEQQQTKAEDQLQSLNTQVAAATSKATQLEDRIEKFILQQEQQIQKQEQEWKQTLLLSTSEALATSNLPSSSPTIQTSGIRVVSGIFDEQE